MLENSERESVRHQRHCVDMPGSRAYTLKHRVPRIFNVIIQLDKEFILKPARFGSSHKTRLTAETRRTQRNSLTKTVKHFAFFASLR